jgi:hypothetical protein
MGQRPEFMSPARFFQINVRSKSCHRSRKSHSKEGHGAPATSIALKFAKSQGAMRCGNHGGFMLIDPHSNSVVEGARFELRPEEVIENCWDRRV